MQPHRAIGKRGQGGRLLRCSHALDVCVWNSNWLLECSHTGPLEARIYTVSLEIGKHGIYDVLLCGGCD